MKHIIILLIFNTSFGWAQQSPNSKWSSAFQNFYKTTPPVRIHFSFNQPSYAPGDTAFFKASVLAASDKFPIKGSQILSIDLVDQNGEVKIHNEFRVMDGWSGNQLILPDYLSPGLYQVVVYSDWTKNFDSQLFFQTTLHISGEEVFEQVPKASGINYYPEGGKLIEGVLNKVTLVLPSHMVSATVEDDRGQLIKTIELEAGYGSFFLTPEQQRSYSIKYGNEVIPLSIVPDGIAIEFRPSPTVKTHHHVKLSVPENSSHRDKDLVLLISGHEGLYHNSMLSFGKKDSINLDIQSSSLPSGIIFLSVNNLSGEEIATRLFYNPTPSKVRTSIQLPKKEFTTREEVPVSVSITGSDDEPELARMSITVYNESLFTQLPNFETQIDHYMLIRSDLLETGAYPFKKEPSIKELDRYLSTKSWPWYTWRQLLENPPKPNSFMKKYLFTEGRVVDANGVAIQDSLMITLYLLGTGDLYEVQTESTGEFYATFLLDYYDRDEFYFRIERKGKKVNDSRIELKSEEVFYTKWPQASVLKANDLYSRYSRQRVAILQSFRFFDKAGRTLPTRNNPNEVFEERIMGADFEMDMDDYTRLPSIKETLHEIIPYLQYRKIRGKDIVRMYLPDKKEAPEEAPIFVIDGVLTDDSDYFLSLNPSDVDKIKIVYTPDKRSYMGAIGKNGIVLVETKIQNNASLIPRKQSSFFVNGLSVPIRFYNSTPDRNKDARTPLLQPCLFWSAEERLDEKGKVTFKFSTTDDVGRYIIRVEGLTTTGTPFTLTEYFDVSYKNN